MVSAPAAATPAAAAVTARRSNGAALLPGSVELVRREFDLALGLAGQFWKAVPVIVPLVDGRAFRAFSTPGCGKAAIGFEIVAEGAGSRLSTETRVVTTVAATRRNANPRCTAGATSLGYVV